MKLSRRVKPVKLAEKKGGLMNENQVFLKIPQPKLPETV